MKTRIFARFVVLGLLLPLSAAISFAADTAALEQEAVTLLAQYLRVDTTNPPGNEIKGAEFFKAIFDREAIAAQIFESAPGRGNIIARLKGDGSKKAIVLLNHLDVVPADRRHWTAEPFGGEVKDGYIYGRGALDMKGLGIVELAVMLALKREGAPLKSDLIFLGAADEEAGGKMGAGYMVREHFDLLQDAGLVLNEMGLISAGEDGKSRFWGVSPAEKVPFWLKLTATGTPGHGSGPIRDSAVDKLIEALHRLAAWETPLKVEPVVQRFYAETAALEPDPARREKLKNLGEALRDPAFAAEFTKDRWNNAAVRNTISITMLEGSNKVNVIPAEASAEVDVRLLPSEDPARFVAELRKVIGDDSIKIETQMTFPSSASPADSEFMKAITEIAGRFDPGVPVVPRLLAGFTDSHFFREKGIPAYGFTPFKVTEKEQGGIHGNDERLAVENLQFGVRVMNELVRKLAQ